MPSDAAATQQRYELRPDLPRVARSRGNVLSAAVGSVGLGGFRSSPWLGLAKTDLDQRRCRPARWHVGRLYTRRRAAVSPPCDEPAGGVCRQRALAL